MDPGNWFLALPAEGGDWYAERVPPTPAGTRRFAAEDLHLTVAFLGAVGEERAHAAWAAALERLPELPEWEAASFEASLDEVVLMGNPKRGTALAATLARGRAQVEAAMGSLRHHAWLAAGAREDRRPPRAHLSMARIQRGAGPEERAAALAWADAVDVSGVRLRLDRLALYGWARDRSLRQFRIAAEHALAPAP